MSIKLPSLLNPDRFIGDWLLRHGLYWLVFVGSAALVCSYWWDSLGQALAATLLHSLILYAPVTYLLLYGVLPKLLDGQYSSFALRLLGWLGASFALRYGITHALAVTMTSSANSANPLRQLFDGSFMVTNSMVVVAAALKLLRYGYQQEQNRQQLAGETLAAELQLLRAQLQPHFLFNTLNNIYSLTLRRSAQAGPSVQTLAGLLGFMVGQQDAAWVELDRELQLLRDYVALEQLRYGDRLTVHWHADGPFAGGLIAPLLLLPFVENAFKHGASAQTGPARISLRVSVAGNRLTFQLENSKPDQPAMAAKAGGLGLRNVGKRLDLLYPNQHLLTINQAARQYTVLLILPLHTKADSLRERQRSRSFSPVTTFKSFAR